MTVSRARELVDEMVARPDAVRGDEPAIVELVQLGPEAVSAVADVMSVTEKGEHHPHEVVETLTHVLAQIAKSDPSAVLEHLDPADPNVRVFVSALGSAKPTPQVVSALKRMVTCDDATVRYAAANSLVCLGTREAAHALVSALNDTYPPVQSVAVQAVADNMVYRIHEAIEPLRRIVSDTRLKRTAPETWEQAKNALEEME